MEIEDKNFCNGYALGTAIFSQFGLPEIKWQQESMSLHIAEQCCNADGELAIWQVLDNGKNTDSVTFHPDLDISDARRVAGILMAWADYFEAKNTEESNRRHKVGSSIFIEGWPDPVKIVDYAFTKIGKVYVIEHTDGSKGTIKESEILEEPKP